MRRGATASTSSPRTARLSVMAVRSIAPAVTYTLEVTDPIVAINSPAGGCAAGGDDRHRLQPELWRDGRQWFSYIRYCLGLIGTARHDALGRRHPVRHAQCGGELQLRHHRLGQHTRRRWWSVRQRRGDLHARSHRSHHSDHRSRGGGTSRSGDDRRRLQSRLSPRAAAMARMSSPSPPAHPHLPA